MAERLSPHREHDEDLDLDVGTLRSRLKQLSECVRLDLRDTADASFLDSKNLLEDCLVDLLSARSEIELEDQRVDSLCSKDSEAFLEQLKRELALVEDEKSRTEDEIMGLIRNIHEDSSQLYSDLGALDCSLELSNSADVHGLQGSVLNFRPVCGNLQESVMNSCEDEKFKILQLDSQIEKARYYLSCFENLDSVFKRNKAIGQIEDMLSEEVKLIEFEGGCFRLSLRTPFSVLSGFLLGQKFDFVMDPLVLYHELSIEVVDETMELKKLEIFPNDVCLDDIISASKSSRRFFSSYSDASVKSSLEWLVRKVKQQILLCNLRRLVVKNASNLRHSFEYSDKDETITAHLVGGIDAFIKLSQGWPISPSALQLISIKNLDIHLRGVPFSFFYKIKELANSLDPETRHHLPRFTDAIEEIFVREMHQNT